MKSDSEIKSTTNYFINRKQRQVFPPTTHSHASPGKAHKGLCPHRHFYYQPSFVWKKMYAFSFLLSLVLQKSGKPQSQKQIQGR